MFIYELIATLYSFLTIFQILTWFVFYNILQSSWLMAMGRYLFFIYNFMGNIQNARIDAHVNSLDELGTDLHEILAVHATDQEVDDMKNRVDGIF